MSEITFAVQAPDKATFLASWVEAGILQEVTDENGTRHEFTPEYRDNIEVRDWGSGQITTTTVVDGEPVTTIKPGFYCNVRVTGSLVAEMTYQLPQTDEDGNLLSVFDRTWATNIFQLQWRDRDPLTNFPPGYQNSAGVAYTDMADIATPYEVRQ